jgi:hypothetical protein
MSDALQTNVVELVPNRLAHDIPAGPEITDVAFKLRGGTPSAQSKSQIVFLVPER